MFEIGWSELLLIGVVALIVIGPKDLPEMFRQLGRITAKLRSMAREFSRAMEDAAKESGVSDVAKDLKSATRPVSNSLDGLRSAADRLEKWDPLKSPRPTLPSAPAVPTAAADAPADPAATATTPVPASAPLTAETAMPPAATASAVAVPTAAAAPVTETPVAETPVAAAAAPAAADETPAAPKRSPGRTRKTETPKA